ncbi:MAG TPA: tetratricopeptide repeat protein, partial [Stenomitos sp.]
VGTAIAAVIVRLSRLPEYQDYREPLQSLARRAVKEWGTSSQLPEFSAAELDPLQDMNLSGLFALNPMEFATVRALTPEIWTRLLNTWQQKDPEFMRDPKVMREVADRLHVEFPQALRAVVKEDFAKGGQVFAGLILDLLGDVCSTLQAQHEIVLARIDALEGVDRGQAEREYELVLVRLEGLTAGNTEAFQGLARQIESGFGNIAQLLADLSGQLDALKTEFLEQQQQGFQRLEEKLDGREKTIAVSVVIDSSRPTARFWQGRETELKTLRQQLDRVALVGITGLGGYGKSALANRVFEVLDWPTKIWVTMNQPYRFSELGRWLLGKLGYELDEKADDDSVATELTNRLAEQRCLVVLDNLETLLDRNGQWYLPGYEGFLLKWLEYGRNSVVLITSREQPCLPSRNSYWHPPLTGLVATEGAKLLQDYGVTGDEEVIREFALLADGHPLLLGLAAALLEDEFGPNADIAGLKVSEFNLFDLVGLHRGDPEASVNKLFAATFARLDERLQRLLCCVSVYRLPFSAAAAAVMLKETALTWQDLTVQRQIEQDLRSLAKRSLLQESQRTEVTERTFQFLPLIASYIRRKPNHWTWPHERAIFFYRATAKPTGWATDEDLREYLEAFYHHCELQQFVMAKKILDLCNSFLTLRGYYRIQIDLYSQLVPNWQPSTQQESLDFSGILTNLGNAYDAVGDYAQAISYHEQSLPISSQIGDRNGEASSLGNLGNVYNALGDYVKAIDYYKQSLAIQSELQARKGVAISLNNLGIVYDSLGDYAKAIDYYEQSLAIFRKIGDRNGEASSVGNLGNTYNALGDYTKAIDCHEQSLAIQYELGDRKGVAVSLNNLGNASLCLGDYVKASSYYEQSLTITTEIGDRNGLASALSSLGTVYDSRGDYVQAICYYERSLAIRHEIGDRKGVAVSLGNLGNASNALGDYTKAIDCHEQSLAIRHEIGDRKGLAVSLNNLGTVYDSLGDYTKASDYYEQSLAIFREIGDRNGEASSLGNIGNVYNVLGDSFKAISYYEQCLAMTRELGDHRGQASSWLNLGNTLVKVDRVPDALGAYRNARQLYADMVLETDVQDCDNAIGRLTSVPTPPRPQPCNPLARLWQWFNQWIRAFFRL